MSTTSTTFSVITMRIPQKLTLMTKQIFAEMVTLFDEKLLFPEMLSLMDKIIEQFVVIEFYQ